MHILLAEGVGIADFSITSDQFPVMIGRSDEATVYVNDPWASRKHCRLEFDGENVVVCDLSRNGTIVNGSKIERSVLTEGDVVLIGRAGFRVCCVQDPSVPPMSSIGRFQRSDTPEDVHETTMESACSESVY